MEGTPWGRRPVAAHRFGIEVELVTADDLGTETLVRALTQLATAGLHGMVTAITKIVLDGTPQPTAGSTTLLPEPGRIRPPRDPKLDAALSEIERIISSLRAQEPPIPFSVVA